MQIVVGGREQQTKPVLEQGAVLALKLGWYAGLLLRCILVC